MTANFGYSRLKSLIFKTFPRRLRWILTIKTWDTQKRTTAQSSAISDKQVTSNWSMIDYWTESKVTRIHPKIECSIIWGPHPTFGWGLFWNLRGLGSLFQNLNFETLLRDVVSLLTTDDISVSVNHCSSVTWNRTRREGKGLELFLLLLSHLQLRRNLL